MATIAFDLGGTKLASALFNEEEIVFRNSTQLEGRKGKQVGQMIREMGNTLLEIAVDRNLQVDALGICVPGISYQQNGTVWAPNIEEWEEYPLLDELRNEFSKRIPRICIDSDRACSILGEVWKGNAKNSRDAIFLAVGTGIGAGIMINGEVLRGSNDIAGAIGWMALDRPFKDGYASCGCFEHQASGEGIAKMARESVTSGRFPGSVFINKDFERISAHDIFKYYEAGDELAVAVIDNAISAWGMAIANLVSLFNPQKIILGGGVFGPALKFKSAIFEEAVKWAQPISMKQLSLESSALGADAGLYGAAFLAIRK